MKVTEVFNKIQPTLSFEFFPPKNLEQENNLFAVIDQLKAFKPDFVSVTYGAMGTTQEKTFYWAKKIKTDFNIEPVAHLTCIVATKASIRQQLDELENLEVRNILALRGDPPEGQTGIVPPTDGFRYAKDLIKFIKNSKPDFCVGAAGFPEGHVQAPNLELDTEYLKQKIEAGAEYVISQLFFDNQYFFKFLDRSKKAGIKVPIVPGLMPITSVKQIMKMTKVCGATMPRDLLARIEKYGADKKAIEQIGVEQAIKQCQELLAAKVPGLHFYVMNQAGPISKILQEIKR